MGDIGRPIREIELEPLPTTEPVHEPAPSADPAPVVEPAPLAPEKEPVPA